jgi:hypothetical protein
VTGCLLTEWQVVLCQQCRPYNQWCCAPFVRNAG